ncbi:hypothetical protein [Vreelandella populi]|uniref:Uncharacterized protein n=1 Tax=Vreelandella populi TaxID=2498858 RepID=A0A3S0Y9U5_9GAMM|nr:hypothetical protein [Halomonas populi]RUR35994.1 hypothetical protein ELY25_13800 [Halomonas populi]RUR43265.1 hypothetical protein ELY37_19120 [Halomonas populi]
MNTTQGSNSVDKDWLVDSSALLDDGKTRVIFYNSQDESECSDLLFELEGMTVEEIVMRLDIGTELSYAQFCEIIVELAESGFLHSYCDI